MIIIAGDSWACGEFDQGKIVHAGITEYFIKDRHQVVNIGIPNGSNFMTVDKLEATLLYLQVKKCLTDDSIVIVFQTEWHRDFRQIANSHLSDFYENVEVSFFKPNVAIDQFFIEKLLSRYYYKLSDIAQKFSIPIYLVGGCTDTMWLDFFSKEYPGVSILCQSLTEFLITDSTRIDDPVFSLYFPDLFLSLIKAQVKNNKDFEYLLKIINQGDNRRRLWRTMPEYFWPDGDHANRTGHLKLYHLIKDQIFNNS